MSDVLHVVVSNDEEQLSLWRADRPLPAGWCESGFRGTEPECLGHIAATWTDLRPRRVRESHLAARTASPGAATDARRGEP